ncbi:uncharacterized protein LOC110867455 [Helianthus annuus]|uniref:uncharacterized protein LOC110867455 n=1 Tax=Helianthus annuus TaxID=4232 RepID=UPI000B902613|nr:uncharacterized protein LOC110867455 [Helianthus annuus]
MATKTRNQELEELVKEHEKMIQQFTSTIDDLRVSNSSIQSTLATLTDQLTNKGSLDDEINNQITKPDRSHTNTRLCKLEFPKFDGSDVNGWIYRAEHFFAVDETPEQSKLEIAVIYLEGKALQWHQGHLKARNVTVKDIVWEDYKQDVIHRFADSFVENAFEDLISLKQTGGLEDYCDVFDSLLNKVSDVNEAQAVCMFVHGLVSEIAGPVRMFKPKTLNEAYSLARIQNDTINRPKNRSNSVARFFFSFKWPCKCF